MATKEVINATDTVAQAKATKTAKAEKKATEPKAPKAEVVKDTKNGVTRPGAETSTGKVWAIADTLHAQATKEEPISRAAVIKAAEAQGINVSTAATQYGRWRTYNGLGKETSKAVKVEKQAETAAPAPALDPAAAEADKEPKSPFTL